jgi:hypothetical protein
MHKGVEWVSLDTPVITIALKMQKLDIGAVPGKWAYRDGCDRDIT